MGDEKDNLIQYKVVNIITDNDFTFKDDYLYLDDTNNMIINKIINYRYPDSPISVDEIYAYSGDNSICFNYDNIGTMNHIIKDNKISNIHPDPDFINEMGLQKVVKKNDYMSKLFEENDISDNTIYYFSLRELFKIQLDIDLMRKPNIMELNSKVGDFNKYYNGVIRKFFPKINKNNITNYPDYNKRSEKEYIRIKNLVKNKYEIFKLLNDKIYDDKNILTEDKHLFKLMKLSTKFTSDNKVNITKLFADFPLSKTYLLSKLLLEDYEDTYFKLCKDSLKLELSTDDKLVTKKLCKSFLKDYKEYIPLNIGFVPSFVKYENVFFIKIHTEIKSGNVFFSFILHLDGNIDLIINNYNNINIDIKEDLKIIVDESNIIIDRINNNRIYSYQKIPTLVLNDNLNLEYFNYDLVYSLENFTDDKGRYLYKKTNIMKFINNFYTHFRLLKERMELEDNDSIHIHYKRVSDYENMDVFDSVISALKHPRFNYSNDQIIDIIHENYGITMEVAKTVFIDWEEKNTLKEEQGKKIYRFASKEPGSEIIIDKHVEKFIRIQTMNVSSFQEYFRLNRFIRFMMNQYQDFVSLKSNKTYLELFTNVNKVTEKISKIENKVVEPSKIKPKEIVEDSESEEEIVEEEDEEPVKDSVKKSSSSSGVDIPTDESSGVDIPTDESSGVDIPTDESSGNGLPGGGSSESEIINIANYFTKKLESHDSDLFKKNARLCQANANKQVVALSDDELERVQKNDILNYANITSDERRDLSKFSVKELIEKLNINPTVFQSYSDVISQTKTSDPSVNVHYICPKYWDVRRDLPIHPRDIYKYVDDIIPPGQKKGRVDKSVFSRTGSQWNNIRDDIFKTQIYDILVKHGIDNKEILNLNWDKFQEYIDSLKLDKDGPIHNEIDKVYQNITKIIVPRWLNNKIFNGKQYPCCYKTKIGKPKKVQKLITKISTVQEIKISKLSPCNPEKYCHVHPKLQKLFNHDDDITESDLGGFVVKGVIQDNNSLIHTLISLDYDYDNKIKSLNNKELSRRIKTAYQHKNIGYTKDQIEQDLSGESDKNIRQYLKNNPYDYIEHVLIKHLNIDPYYTMMRLGDGNIVQLFKSDKYKIKDISYFIDILKSNFFSFETINLDHEVENIKNHFDGFSKSSKYIKYEFDDKVNSYSNPHIIVFIYNIIISHNNYINYLNSNEIKDHKYILPLIKEIYHKNIFVFENVNENVNLQLQLFKYDTSIDNTQFIYKKGNRYEPIYYFNHAKLPDSIINNTSGKYDEKIKSYHRLIIEGICNLIKGQYDQNNEQLNIKSYSDIVNNKIKDDHKKYLFFVDNYCKISHIIDIKTHDIYPIVPSVIKSDLHLIYDFPNTLPKYDSIKCKYHKKGIIVNKNNDIIEIIYDNNIFIPIQPIKYNKSNKSSILGNISYKDINNDLLLDKPCNDDSMKFNNSYNYTKYITRLIIQSLIHHIKEDKEVRKYYTHDNGTYNEGVTYDFKIIYEKINGNLEKFVIKNNDFFNQHESNKFTGKVLEYGSSNSDIPDTNKLSVEINKSYIIDLIINNNILLNYDKQTKLWKIINEIIKNNEIFEIKDEKEYDSSVNKLNKDINIYTDKTFSNKCIFDYKSNKLIINEKYNESFENIKLKVIWNLVELLIINKDIDSVNNIIQNNFDRGDLYKSEKDGEIFFTYAEFIRKDKFTREYLKLDEIFRFKSLFIRDINFYDFNNDAPVPNKSNEPLQSELSQIPNIIKNLFGSKTTIITYFDKYNSDFITVGRGLKQCLENTPEEVNSNTIKHLVYKKEYLKIGMDVSFYHKKDKRKYTGKIKSIGPSKILGENEVEVDNSYKIYRVTLSKLQYDESFKINADDLQRLVDNGDFPPGIGFLLITNNKDTDLKQNLELIYNESNISKDTKFILLYYLKNNEIDNLTNIVIKNKYYYYYLTLEKLFDITKIKKIISDDYSDLNKLF